MGLLAGRLVSFAADSLGRARRRPCVVLGWNVAESPLMAN